ncbi:apolipoprotein D and lipocalin family protein [Loktanella fryxellensis]|uniref:Outer membrane lipoprotein Blc n=1 Tax=Loktanella fryxellensis TaxID=245187 RepID=A0A1H8ESE3_9RHOB|nr:lipocalin family protein [Loktanella fryxellensis]SEN21797.1 apolipoprotein D and lipocalin family protein [Loktanella fryxellensis]
MRARLATLALLALLSACAKPQPGEPVGGLLEVYRDRSVPIGSALNFDAGRYAGTWYEVARYPVPFETGCVGVTAEYAPLPDGGLSVLNTCRTPDGNVRSTIEGRAEVVGPGRLTVRFDTVPFAADYWVLWIDEGYRTAVVGAPDGRSGWILNRDPQIPADRLAAARDVLEFNGYDLSRLVMVGQ